MRNFTLLLIFLFSAIFSFGQTPDFDPSDVSVLKAIRDNAANDSPLKTEWVDESAIGSWAGVKWTDSTPKKVKELELIDKKMATCNLTKLDKLEQLTCYGNPQLTLLEVNGLSNLKHLDCWSNGTLDANKLTSLDLSGLINLETLYCQGNKLKSLDLSGLIKLKDLCCNNTLLSSLDLSPLISLETLTCADNQIISINFGELNSLKSIFCSNNRLETIDLSGLINLENLDCQLNRLTSLNLSGLLNLQSLFCSDNQLTSFNLSGFTKLKYIKCNSNQLPFSSLKTTLHLELSPFSPSLGPQSPTFGKMKNIKVGDVLDLSSEADVNGTATVFTWYKYGKKIDGTDQSGKYKVEELASYYCTMTNAKFPGLTLATNTIFPAVVDNSKWFPPVRNQQNLGDCNHFSLIYYLKSAIWNRQFNRDPKLEVNQFSHSFVWNQNINPIYKNAGQLEAFYFMKSQGCATVADFPINEQSDQIKPTLIVREKALAYKSKRVFQGAFFGNGGGNKEVGQHITDLKDSLIQGKCFSIDVPIFRYIMKMTTKSNVYNCYPGIKSDSVWVYHTFTIVGYNDTILTANGRGAFQVIDSDSNLVLGHYYMDYNWFYFATWQPYCYYFLEEDFSNQPSIVLSFNLSNAISGADLWNLKNLFVDTTINSSGKKFDFIDPIDYFCNQNQIQVTNINNKEVKMRNKVIIKPKNNLDGNYELISDISDLSSVSDFKSVSVVVFDPISVNYIGADDQSFYSYTRESKLVVNKAYLNFFGTSNQIIAEVKDLSDTTIVTTDFYSAVAGLNLNQNNIYVKSCTSVLKRKLITFSISDLTDAISNIEVPEYTLKAYPNPMINNTTVEFSLSDRGNVDLGIFDTLGRQVENITNQEYEAGTHQLIFDSKDLPDGIYIACLRTSAGTKTVKLIKSSGLN